MAKTKNFRKKVTVVCGSDDLRPIMQHVFFDDGFLICTDGHILLKQSLKQNIFYDEEISIMNGKYLHRNAFDEVFRYDMVTVSEDGFTCRKGGVECLIKFSEPDGVYPKWKAVLPENKNKGSVDEIGINVNLLNRINKITLSYKKAMKFEFHGKNRGILITPMDSDLTPEDETILVMPAMLG